MKKISLAIVLTIICVNIQAQINQGRVMLSPSFSYNSYKDEMKYDAPFQGVELKRTSYNSNINYGFLITDHLMIGIFGTYGGSKQEQKNPPSNINTQTQIQKNQSYGGGLFARYYQMIGGSKFAFFGQIASDYKMYKGENKTIGANPTTNTNMQSSKGSGFAVRLSPGLVYFINKTFAVEATFGNLGYLYSKSKYYNNGIFSLEAKNSNYGFDFLGGLSFGLNFYFGTVKDRAPETK